MKWSQIKKWQSYALNNTIVKAVWRIIKIKSERAIWIKEIG